MDFDASLKPEIKARYAGKILKPNIVGEVGAELSTTWTSDDKLQLIATSGIYVAGEFRQLVDGELLSARGPVLHEDLGDKTILPFRQK